MRTETNQRRKPADDSHIAFENDVFDDTEVEFAEDQEMETLMQEPDFNTRRLDANTVMLLTARLAQVLAAETDLLSAMRVGEIENLQKEKIMLVEALERQKRLIERRPELLLTISDDQALELAQVIEIFQAVMKENHRRLLIAREVNRKVVEAISEAVAEANQHQVYDNKGAPDTSTGSIAVSLDKRI